MLRGFISFRYWRWVIIIFCAVNIALVILAAFTLSLRKSQPKSTPNVDLLNIFATGGRSPSGMKMESWTYKEIRVKHDKPTGYAWFFDDTLLNSSITTVDMKYMPDVNRNRPGYTQFTLINRKKGQTKFRAIYCKYKDFKGFNMKIDK